MCTTCGCGDGGQFHLHGHTHGHSHSHGPAEPGLVAVETAILSKNDTLAAANRRALAGLGAFSVNLVSSPGAGKTTLLCKTIAALNGTPLAVIEGDQQTTCDADRIREAGARAVQINTGKGCHLDAHMVGHAIDDLALVPASLLFIENVGNLVCPAAFDLGEDARVAILSVTEGEDKPLKYADIFATARLAILTKIDLAPHCDADLDAYEANLRRVNPDIEVMRVSAKTGEGVGAWIAWLRRGLAAKSLGQAAE
ncbi:hydrogenase nickel incorporation protein HypB [Ostreiculturibacter nitratireducens]|uniref:hydrogenase nickel incorporation protein HypB n=1 Tax=Ostreiculturibacter nitratireducens TaxID=3075226 RepID=UPI0031B5DBB3